jgi:tripartite-type tricarboxylate transporter receptor subunit TctC
MPLRRRHLLQLGGATALAAAAAARSARAQTYPARAVRLIVPFGPSSGADIAARLFADRLAARWGKPVVVENRPGADGLLAIGAFTSANDDHTLLVCRSAPSRYIPIRTTRCRMMPSATCSRSRA